jgi:hypothetical protein
MSRSDVCYIRTPHAPPRSMWQGPPGRCCARCVRRPGPGVVRGVSPTLTRQAEAGSARGCDIILLPHALTACNTCDYMISHDHYMEGKMLMDYYSRYCHGFIIVLVIIATMIGVI